MKGAVYDAPDPEFPQSWNRYAYVKNQPLMLVDPLGTCATVRLNDRSSNNDEISGDFGPYVSQNEMAEGVPGGADPQRCLFYGSTSPWDMLDIDGAPVGYMGGGMGLAEDLEYGGPGGTGAAVGGIQTYSIGSGLQTRAYEAHINPLQKQLTVNPSRTCTGVGRGLAGNAGLVGREGGIPGQTVQLGTAAVIPQQFDVPNGAALAPYARYIHGSIGNASFSGVSDVIGGRSPIPGLNVRRALEQIYPGQLILEIPGAADQGSNAPVIITVPNGLGCPTGTSAVGGN